MHPCHPLGFSGTKGEMVCNNCGIKFTDSENGTAPAPYLPIYPRELRICVGCYYRICCFVKITNSAKHAICQLHYSMQLSYIEIKVTSTFAREFIKNWELVSRYLRKFYIIIKKVFKITLDFFK